MAEMPCSAQSAKMLIYAAVFGCLDPVLTVAASLNFKDPFIIKQSERVRED